MTRRTVTGLCALTALALSLAAIPVLGGTAIAAASTSATAKPMAATWTVDPVHSCALFRIRHLGAGFFWGRFNDVNGTITFDAAASESFAMDISIDVDSVDSGHPDLDRHLKSPDFFDSKEFPKMTFKSTSVEQVMTTKRLDDPAMAWDVTGKLSMHGTTKDLTARVLYWGAKDVGRGMKAGFETSFKVKRSEFGMNYGVQQGAVGDMVTVTVAFEASKDS